MSVSDSASAPAFSLHEVTPTSRVDFAVLDEATADLEPPFAVIDVGALRSNADALVRRAAGKPVRVASKSVRCLAITTAVLDLDGFAGILALTLPEALLLARSCQDVVVGYPTTDRRSLMTLASDPVLAQRITLMVDAPEHLDLIENAAVPDGPPIRVCLDLDASLRLLDGRVHLGPRRSPLHSPQEAMAFAREIARRPPLRLVGMMAYEGQIAGVGDDAGSAANKLLVRAMQSRSRRELAQRRAEAVAALRAIADLEFVNGGGTGSVAETAAEDAVTEVAAGSGLYCPTLFDGYRRFRATPAAFFVTSVVRRPAPDLATVLGGGWVASGTAGPEKLPTPVWPAGLALTDLEGAGEAQTPLTGGGALQVGDRVWFRHAKAGELCERVNELHLVEGGRVVATVPTYRGEGLAFL
ncbi:MAG: amino acid deaminase/aldolase [Phycicoccus sp.]|nr:amino acid deaminase/aldolase [Phycicoccus sp.]